MEILVKRITWVNVLRNYSIDSFILHFCSFFFPFELFLFFYFIALFLPSFLTYFIIYIQLSLLFFALPVPPTDLKQEKLREKKKSYEMTLNQCWSFYTIHFSVLIHFTAKMTTLPEIHLWDTCEPTDRLQFALKWSFNFTNPAGGWTSRWVSLHPDHRQDRSSSSSGGEEWNKWPTQSWNQSNLLLPPLSCSRLHHERPHIRVGQEGSRAGGRRADATSVHTQRGEGPALLHQTLQHRRVGRQLDMASDSLFLIISLHFSPPSVGYRSFHGFQSDLFNSLPLWSRKSRIFSTQVKKIYDCRDNANQLLTCFLWTLVFLLVVYTSIFIANTLFCCTFPRCFLKQDVPLHRYIWDLRQWLDFIRLCSFP